jgi:Cation/multidrug efflux pump
MGLAAVRSVPLKMLPFDNKNELLLVLDFDRGTTLERSDAAVREIEVYLAKVPEVGDYTSYVGLGSPMDFNGLVRTTISGKAITLQTYGSIWRQKEPQLAEPRDRPADAE